MCPKSLAAGSTYGGGIRRLVHARPETLMMTCTRRGAYEVNFLCLQAKYPHFPARRTVDADIETNPVNHDDPGNLKQDDWLQCTQVPIFTRIRVAFTRNARPQVDFVSGMHGRVESWHAPTACVRVRTDIGFLAPVWRWTDINLHSATYHPIRLVYAASTLKWAGTELKHVTVHLDAPHVPVVAHTASSRVSCASDVFNRRESDCGPLYNRAFVHTC